MAAGGSTPRSVAERRRELAIRAALGAESPTLAAMVVREGLMPVALGAWMGARILEQLALACLLPARLESE